MEPRPSPPRNLTMSTEDGKAERDEAERDEVRRQAIHRARSGSHKAFRSLVEPYEAELQRHCYRMTGSVDDADDLVQETLFRAWRSLGTYSGRGSFRAWLYKIATNKTLDLLGSAPRRREVINGADEPAWLQPLPTPELLDDTQEAVVSLEMIGLAFIAALQNLPARQRAALILRDVLGYSAVEAAEILECTVPSVTSALQRARSKLEELDTSTQTSGTAAEQSEVVDRFVAAWQANDVDAIIQLLHETAHITMPPHPLEFLGNRDIADFFVSFVPEGSLANSYLRPVAANGQPGIAIYLPDAAEDRYVRHCVMFFESSATSVHKITGFNTDDICDLLELPATLPPSELV